MAAFARRFVSLIDGVPFVLFAIASCVSLVFPLTSSDAPTWHVYACRDGKFVAMTPVGHVADRSTTRSPVCPPPDLPSEWEVRAAQPTDLNHDGVPECTLLVWRPWQDWPIMRWSTSPSPIAAHQDARGDSAHIILVTPYSGTHSYRELWAGSALAWPVLKIKAGDVDGDGKQELVVLEGDYAIGRQGPAQNVAVWHWNGFGFTLDWRSAPSQLVDLTLADLDTDRVFEILVRRGSQP